MWGNNQQGPQFGGRFGNSMGGQQQPQYGMPYGNSAPGFQANEQPGIQRMQMGGMSGGPMTSGGGYMGAPQSMLMRGGDQQIQGMQGVGNNSFGNQPMAAGSAPAMYPQIGAPRASFGRAPQQPQFGGQFGGQMYQHQPMQQHGGFGRMPMQQAPPNPMMGMRRSAGGDPTQQGNANFAPQGGSMGAPSGNFFGM